MKIITGITVKEQMNKAKLILDNIVIPREKQYQEIKNMHS